MLFPALILFFLFLLLSAFFSSSETAFIAANPYKLDYLEKKGIKKAKLVRKMIKRMDNLLATILIGNTLVNTAAASVSTFIFVSFINDKNEAVLLATITTTFLILLLSEITPKTYTAYNPLKVSFLFVRPIRIFIILFYPLVQFFTFFSRLMFPSSQRKTLGLPSSLDEEEIRSLLTMGGKGISSLRKKMIAGVLEIGSRPIREIMVPRPQVKAIEKKASLKKILELIISAGFSRYPVFKDRMDNIEGFIHAKDIIPYIIDNKQFKLDEVLRKPLFIPEAASLEKTLIQMQEKAVHFAFVVDEFGTVEGIVTLEDIIEEIIGEIQDEFDTEGEEWIIPIEREVYLVKGVASIKDINEKLPWLALPEKPEYTSLAGFFLYQFGKIPKEGDELDYEGHKFIVEKMNKRHISLVKIVVHREQEGNSDESYSH